MGSSRPSIRGLYVVVDNAASPRRSHLEIAEACLEGGAKILQLRVKQNPPSPPFAKGGMGGIYDLAGEIMKLKSEYEFTFVINDYLDAAKEIGADGYHGGKDDPSIEEARRCLGPDKLVGYSAHSLEEAVEAERRGADYVAFGAIYPSPSKGHGHPVQGVGRLKEVVSVLHVPVVAIGGIGRDNIRKVLSTGVASFAMISALVGAPDIAEETRFYCGLLCRPF